MNVLLPGLVVVAGDGLSLELDLDVPPATLHLGLTETDQQQSHKLYYYEDAKKGFIIQNEKKKKKSI